MVSLKWVYSDDGHELKDGAEVLARIRRGGDYSHIWLLRDKRTILATIMRTDDAEAIIRGWCWSLTGLQLPPRAPEAQPENLTDTLHDRIHPTSGALINATPVKRKKTEPATDEPEKTPRCVVFHSDKMHVSVHRDASLDGKHYTILVGKGNRRYTYGPRTLEDVRKLLFDVRLRTCGNNPVLWSDLPADWT